MSQRAHDQKWRHRSNWVDPDHHKKVELVNASLKDLGSAPLKILDLGCGDGLMTETLSSQGHRVTGADISPVIIEENQRRFPHIPFLLVEPDRSLPFEAKAFDAIYCSEVIEHVYDIDLFFAEVSRALRPGGLFLLTTPFHGKFKNLIVSLFFFERHFDVRSQHIRFWTAKSLQQVAASHNLAIKETGGVGRVWPVFRSLYAALTSRS